VRVHHDQRVQTPAHARQRRLYESVCGGQIVAGVPAADQALSSREDMARAARLSQSQMVLIEKIQKQATPEVVAAVKSGVISLNAAAAVASLSAPEQVAAAAAGKDELKQAAKRVRDAKRKPREVEATDVSADPQDSDASAASETAGPVTAADEIKALKKRVAALQAENDALRKQVLNLLAKRGGLPEGGV
jgi:hypothetical protein